MFLLPGIAAGSACWPHVRPVPCCHVLWGRPGSLGDPGRAARNVPHLRSSSKAAQKGHDFWRAMLLAERLERTHCLP